MDIEKDADAVSAELGHPSTVPPGADVQESTGTNTPAGIKSSPPALSTIPKLSSATAHNVDVDNDSASGSKSDSEAETVVLPGINGHSPSKIRKKRKIKLEDDKTNENGSLNDAEGDVDMDMDMDIQKAIADSQMGDGKPQGEGEGEGDGVGASEGATSLLGKRKRSKYGASRFDNSNATGNSSGLSSVPTSPVAPTRSTLSKRADSESEISKSPSPRIIRKEKAKSADRTILKTENQESGSDRDKETRRTHRRRSSAQEASSSSKHSKDPRAKSSLEGGLRHKRTRSQSPIYQDTSSSLHRHTSTGPANGLSHKKKAVPAPLRSTKSAKDYHSTDYHSDDSSVGEARHPRRSRTRNLATPPTGDSSHSYAKMAGHRKKPDKFGRTPLTDACEDGDYDKAKLLLQESAEDLDQPDAAGNTPLQCASLNGHSDIVKLLLDTGCDKNCVNSLRDSPLLDAVENGHLDVVKLLLDAGVNPRARNLKGEEPIMKINEDDEDAEAIREALMAARPLYAQAHPSTAKDTPHLEASGSSSRKTQSHGRWTKTGEHQLYRRMNVGEMRTAAAMGDLETVYTIAEVNSSHGFDDPESLVAAARGGHEEVLQVLLAIGQANPDPAPVKSPNIRPEHATPMLAAIGGENISVINLLLAQGQFDPTRQYEGKYYFEIARERAGPLWKEEEKMLKEAFDKYKTSAKSSRNESSSNQQSRSHHSKTGSGDRPNGSKSKQPGGSNGDTYESRREHRASTTPGSTPLKRGPGRPRKEGAESSERESAPTSSHKESSSSKRSESDYTTIPVDIEPVKPRRKLVSGKDLKGERERQKSMGSVPSPTSSGKPSGDALKASLPGSKKTSQYLEPGSLSDKARDRARSIKRDESSDRQSISRSDSPVKRRRTSPSPSSESNDRGSRANSDHAVSNKRRRLEADNKSSGREKHPRNSSPDRKSISGRQDGTASKSNHHKEDVEEGKRSHHKEPRKLSPSAERRRSILDPDDSRKSLLHKKAKQLSREQISSNRSSPDAERRSPERKTKSPTREELAAAERIRKEAQEQAELEAKIKREHDEALEKQRIEEERRAEEARLAREAEERRRLEEIAKREKEEAELREQKRLEEVAKREKEEAEIREQKRKEEAEAHRKAEEEKQEQERRRRALLAEQRAERLRLAQEQEAAYKAAQEAARLARLPILLKWFDGLSKHERSEIALSFKSLQGVRYDTIIPEAAGHPDGREQWLLSTQVALLLGEKDLQLSQYTAWDRIPASLLAKRTLLRVDHDMYAMVRNDLRMFNPDLTEFNPLSNHIIPPNKVRELRALTEPLFLNLDLFFVKVSDVMFIVPTIPHLRNVRVDIQYLEIPPDERSFDMLMPPARWKQDPDRELYLGFGPANKVYVNGRLIGEAHVKTASTGATPFPTHRTSRESLVEPHRSESVNDDHPLTPVTQQAVNGNHLISNHISTTLNGHIYSTSPLGIAIPSTNGDLTTHMTTTNFSSVSPGTTNGTNGVL